MRLIDGDAHVQKLRSTYINEIFTDWDLMDEKDQNIILKLMRGYKDIVYSIPAVDAVAVVRCRECKHCRNLPNGLCYLYTEPYDNERGYKGEAVCVEPDDFCSCGERRTDNG